MTLKWNSKLTSAHGQNIKNGASIDEHTFRLVITVEGPKEILQSIREATAAQIVKTGGQELMDEFFDQDYTAKAEASESEDEP